jgi:hypothetical protein
MEKRQCEQEEALPLPWPRRLFFGDSEMVEDGRRPNGKRNHTGDFQLAIASKVFLLCLWRHTKHGRWNVRDYQSNRKAADRLDTILKAIAEGSLKPDREKDELAHALGTPEHTRRV